MKTNLPPGVSDRDIPGNDNEEWDDLFNWLSGTGMEPDEIRRAVASSELRKYAKQAEHFFVNAIQYGAFTNEGDCNKETSAAKYLSDIGMLETIDSAIQREIQEMPNSRKCA